MPIDTAKIRANYPGNDSSTHYEACEAVHPYCAIEKLCAEVDRLRAALTQIVDHKRKQYGDRDIPKELGTTIHIARAALAGEETP